MATYNTQALRLAPVGIKKPRRLRGEYKSEADVERIAKHVEAAAADFVVLQEVGAHNELEYVNQNFLKRSFDVWRFPGNDPHGKEIGFLVRKGLPIKIKAESYARKQWFDEKGGRTIPLFSRDAPSLIVSAKGSSKPLFVVIGHHAKSKTGSRHDPRGERHRTAQHEAIAEIVKSYQDRFGRDLPIILAGDFNADIRDSNSVAPLRGPMTDTFDIQPEKLKSEERITHVAFVDENGQSTLRPQPSQLDGILLSSGARANVLQAGVFREKEELPLTYNERKEQASDHYLVFADFELL